MFRSPPRRRKAKDITGDKHIARALHAILQRPGMPVNVITNRAVQVMVDMMRDLMERVMDEAAICADSNGRVTIEAGNIVTGAKLAMHQVISPYGGGCPEIEKGMCVFATQRFTEYNEYLWWEERQAQAIASGAPSIAAPNRSRQAAMKL